MAIQDLKEQIARLPEQPGVYLYANAAGDTIYVGKARSLRDRVRSYLGAYGADARKDALLDEIAALEVIVTDSVVEALALENNLIKQRSPRYNILLRDDKNYPYLQLTTNEAFPRVLVARRVERDGSFYAGPFLPATFARKTMALTHRLFGLRSCNEAITGKRGRPCLEYDIHRCIAPCVDTLCTAEEYQRAVEMTELFLQGRNDELVETLRSRMLEAAAGERFEEAAQLRDAIRTVQTLHDRQQKMATAELGHRDVFGLKLGQAGAVIQVFQVRNGRVIERVELDADASAADSGEAEVLAAALQQFYELRAAPAEVHVPMAPDEQEALEHWLSDRAGRRVRILTPQRGDKRGLVDLANRNAALGYQNRFNQATAAQYDALETLQAVLALPSLPRRIECFDISTIQGAETVASMVVCEDGRMRRGEYRKFRIRGARHDEKTLTTEDAKAASPVNTAERLRPSGAEDVSIRGDGSALVRGGGGAPPPVNTAERLRPSGAEDVSIRGDGSTSVRGGGGAPPPVNTAERLRPSGAEDEGIRGDGSTSVRDGGGAPSPVNNDFAAMREVVHRRYRALLERGGPFPDLVLIDGGKGQLSAAYEALASLGLANLVAVGIAKKEELLFTRDHSDPIALAPSDPALLLIQRIRDEAHRFAVTFHRRARTMRDLRSELDEVPGIGPRRRRLLLTRFGSVAGVRRATREELAAAIGPRAADRVLAFFSSRP